MLTLASASPRRQELLKLTGWEIISRPGDVDEHPEPGELPGPLTRRLALKKALAAGGDLALGADTVVLLGTDLLGKPVGQAEAEGMLRALRGRTHQVISSIVLVDAAGRTLAVDTCVSTVPMREYGESEIAQYLRSGSPFDKAGGYGIQDGDLNPVDMKEMHDCYANVMGLPLCHLVRKMRGLGFEPPADVPGACQAHTGYDCPVYPAILRGEL